MDVEPRAHTMKVNNNLVDAMFGRVLGTDNHVDLSFNSARRGDTRIGGVPRLLALANRLPQTGSTESRCGPICP